MLDWTLVHNPNSRVGRLLLDRVLGKSRELRSPEEPAPRVLALGKLDSIEELPERMLVLGGDGTVNAVAEWMWRRDDGCPLGVIPAGTGNNLARGLGIPLKLEEALELAVKGTRLRPIDVIAYSSPDQERSRLIVQTSALGFPARMAAIYDSLRRRPLLRWLLRPTGPYAYRIIAFLGLAWQKHRERQGRNLLKVRLSFPGESLEETVFAIFLGNERSLGGNFVPCPKAEVDDGLLDICLVRAGTGARYLRLFRDIVRGHHTRLERTVVYHQTPGPITVELSAPSPFLVDGDLWVSSDCYRLEVLPGRLQVVTG
jgi:diacylglycerol kinase (ATP)